MASVGKKPRLCSYCRSAGHDRRTCKPLASDRAEAAEINRNFIELVIDDMVSQGIAPGTLVEFQVGDKHKGIGMITSLNWDGLFFRNSARRWVKVRMLGELGRWQSPWSEHRWIKFSQHEIERQWCDEKNTYVYSKVLAESEHPSTYDMGGTYHRGKWKVVSPVTVTRESLLKTQPLGFSSGWHGIKDFFKDLCIRSWRINGQWP